MDRRPRNGRRGRGNSNRSPAPNNRPPPTGLKRRTSPMRFNAKRGRDHHHRPDPFDHRPPLPVRDIQLEEFIQRQADEFISQEIRLRMEMDAQRLVRDRMLELELDNRRRWQEEGAFRDDGIPIAELERARWAADRVEDVPFYSEERERMRMAMERRDLELLPPPRAELSTGLLNSIEERRGHIYSSRHDDPIVDRLRGRSPRREDRLEDIMRDRERLSPRREGHSLERYRDLSPRRGEHPIGRFDGGDGRYVGREALHHNEHPSLERHGRSPIRPPFTRDARSPQRFNAMDVRSPGRKDPSMDRFFGGEALSPRRDDAILNKFRDARSSRRDGPPLERFPGMEARSPRREEQNFGGLIDRDGKRADPTLDRFHGRRSPGREDRMERVRGRDEMPLQRDEPPLDRFSARETRSPRREESRNTFTGRRSNSPRRGGASSERFHGRDERYDPNRETRDRPLVRDRHSPDRRSRAEQSNRSGPPDREKSSRYSPHGDELFEEMRIHMDSLRRTDHSSHRSNSDKDWGRHSPRRDNIPGTRERISRWDSGSAPRDNVPEGRSRFRYSPRRDEVPLDAEPNRRNRLDSPRRHEPPGHSRADSLDRKRRNSPRRDRGGQEKYSPSRDTSPLPVFPRDNSRDRNRNEPNFDKRRNSASRDGPRDSPRRSGVDSPERRPRHWYSPRRDSSPVDSRNRQEEDRSKHRYSPRRDDPQSDLFHRRGSPVPGRASPLRVVSDSFLMNAGQPPMESNPFTGEIIPAPPQFPFPDIVQNQPLISNEMFSSLYNAQMAHITNIHNPLPTPVPFPNFVENPYAVPMVPTPVPFPNFDNGLLPTPGTMGPFLSNTTIGLLTDNGSDSEWRPPEKGGNKNQKKGKGPILAPINKKAPIRPHFDKWADRNFIAGLHITIRGAQKSKMFTREELDRVKIKMSARFRIAEARFEHNKFLFTAEADDLQKIRDALADLNKELSGKSDLPFRAVVSSTENCYCMVKIPIMSNAEEYLKGVKQQLGVKSPTWHIVKRFEEDNDLFLCLRVRANTVDALKSKGFHVLYKGKDVKFAMFSSWTRLLNYFVGIRKIGTIESTPV